MIRRGTVREDGKLFWAYKVSKGKKYEIWLSKEKYDSYEKTRKKYYSAKLEKYRDDQSKLDPKDRNTFGKYNPENGLYFIRLNSNSIPQYGTLEEVEKFRSKRRAHQKANYDKMIEKTPLPTVCLGDKHQIGRAHV